MERKNILSQINEIFIDTLDNEDLLIEETTQATDVDEWDSLTHIMLVVAIEKKFGIKFTAKQIQQWNCVGDVLNDLNFLQ